ncbi:MAG: hypothetical protein OXG35_01550 [Acidobacteria bacterium]|nr:hypothetical protein [Acidobacteriota bacterium]
MMNETGRRVREQYADTGGFTDHVFAACPANDPRSADRGGSNGVHPRAGDGTA